MDLATLLACMIVLVPCWIVAGFLLGWREAFQHMHDEGLLRSRKTIREIVMERRVRG